MAISNDSTRRVWKPSVKLLLVAGAPMLLATMSILPPTGALARTPNAMPDSSTLPAGTILYLHLQTAVSTKTSKQGQAVAASLAREVGVEGGIAIPFGSTLKGTIEKCSQPTASDQRAELLLSFGQLTIPGEGNFTLKGHLSGSATRGKLCLRMEPSSECSNRRRRHRLLSGVLQKLGQIDSSVNDQIQKQKIGQVNTAVEFPVGTDIQFTLTEPLSLKRLVPSAGPGHTSCQLARLRGKRSGRRAKTRGEQR